MLMYSNDQQDIEKIEDIDFQYLGTAIQGFVNVYRKHVLFTKPTDAQVLQHLEEIARCIKCREYYALLNDTSLVSYIDNDLSAFQEG